MDKHKEEMLNKLRQYTEANRDSSLELLKKYISYPKCRNRLCDNTSMR